MYKTLGIENVALDLVNIRFDFMLLGSYSKPAVGEFKSMLTDHVCLIILS